MKKPILPLLSLLILLSNVDARVWTNIGGDAFEGELLGVSYDTASILRTKDEWVYKVKITDLSDADRNYLKFPLKLLGTVWEFKIFNDNGSEATKIRCFGLNSVYYDYNVHVSSDKKYKMTKGGIYKISGPNNIGFARRKVWTPKLAAL